MHPIVLYRLSALAGLLGGAGIVLLDLAQIFAEVQRRVVGLIELPITLFVLLALPGIYIAQARHAGKLGLLGFVLTFAGVALGMGHFYLVAFVRPVVGERWPEAEAAVGQAAAVVAPFEFVTFILGWILFGAATARARVFHRLPGLLLIGGVILVFVRAFLPLRGPVGGVLIGVGILWLSAELLRGAERVHAQNHAVTAA